MSTDGGAHATTPLTFDGGAFTAFTRMASGSLIAGGVLGTTDVAYRSTDGGGTFTQLPTVPFTFTGLSARGTKLYAATENMTDPYAIYTSIDEGMSWQPLMAFGTNDQQTTPAPVIQAIVSLPQDVLPDRLREPAPGWSSSRRTTPTPSARRRSCPPPSTAARTPLRHRPTPGTRRPPTPGRTRTPGRHRPPTSSSGCHCALPARAPSPRWSWLALLAAAITLAAPPQALTRRAGTFSGRAPMIGEIGP